MMLSSTKLAISKWTPICGVEEDRRSARRERSAFLSPGGIKGAKVIGSQEDAAVASPLTCLEGEVVHHLQPPHHQQVGLERPELAGEVLHGGQVGVVVVAVDDVPAGAEPQTSVLEGGGARGAGLTPVGPA